MFPPLGLAIIPCHLVWANHSLPRLLSPTSNHLLLEGPSDFPLLLTHKNIIPFFLHLSASVFSCYIPYHNTDVLRQQPHAVDLCSSSVPHIQLVAEQYLLNDEFIKSEFDELMFISWFPYVVSLFSFIAFKRPRCEGRKQRGNTVLIFK